MLTFGAHINRWIIVARIEVVLIVRNKMDVVQRHDSNWEDWTAQKHSQYKVRCGSHVYLSLWQPGGAAVYYYVNQQLLKWVWSVIESVLNFYWFYFTHSWSFFLQHRLLRSKVALVRKRATGSRAEKWTCWRRYLGKKSTQSIWIKSRRDSLRNSSTCIQWVAVAEFLPPPFLFPFASFSSFVLHFVLLWESCLLPPAISVENSVCKESGLCVYKKKSILNNIICPIMYFVE